MSKSIGESFSQLLGKTSGRDKLCRVIQYATRFLAAHKRDQAQTGLSKELSLQSVAKLQSLGGAMSMTRKVLRFGRYILLLQQIRQLSQQIQSGKAQNIKKQVAKLLSKLFLTLFFLFDHILFFSKLGWIQNKQTINRADYLSNLFWLLECIASLFYCLFEKRGLKEWNVSFSKKKTTAAGLKYEVARNVLDIPVAFGFMYPGTVSNKVMGILGTITSLIGIAQLWNQ